LTGARAEGIVPRDFRQRTTHVAVIDTRLKITLGVGFLVGAVAMALTLAQAPLTVARVNTAKHTIIGLKYHRTDLCQSDEVLPRQTSAIRLRVGSFLGPRVAVEVLAHGRIIAHGARGSGWSGGVVTVPVRPLSTTRAPVELCFSLFLNGYEYGLLVGEPTKGARGARGPHGPFPGRVRVEYMRLARSSWWSLAPSVARRMGLGHAWSGTWSAVFVIVLMTGVALVCARTVLRELA
jgi:hypothetical protein